MREQERLAQLFMSISLYFYIVVRFVVLWCKGTFFFLFSNILCVILFGLCRFCSAVQNKKSDFCSVVQDTFSLVSEKKKSKY